MLRTAATTILLLTGFMGAPMVAAFSATTSTPTRLASLALGASRRAVLESTIAAAIGHLAVVSPVWAEGFEDISMPTEGEQKTAEVGRPNKRAFAGYPLDSTILQMNLRTFLAELFAGKICHEGKIHEAA